MTRGLKDLPLLQNTKECDAGKWQEVNKVDLSQGGLLLLLCHGEGTKYRVEDDASMKAYIFLTII